MQERYKKELEALPETYALTSGAENCDRLTDALRRASETGILAIGSGGSYSAAALLADLHERACGQLSRAVTPLELTLNPHLAAQKTVFLISAEGNNPDILEAYRASCRAGAADIHILTTKQESRLVKVFRRVDNGTLYVFDTLAKKDGYLATNSLLAITLVLLKSYHKVAPGRIQQPPATVEDVFGGSNQYEAWVNGVEDTLSTLFERDTIIILFDPQLKALAVDMESKFIEAALCNVHIADFRSFAHGRHLWLAKRSVSTSVISLVGENTADLWGRISTILPEETQIHIESTVEKEFSHSVIKTLFFVFHAVLVAGHAAQIDPGKPGVPSFGRELYHDNIRKYLPKAPSLSSSAERSKLSVLGHPSMTTSLPDSVTRAKEEFVAKLCDIQFVGMVLDYDGTICQTDRRYAPPPQKIIDELEVLAKGGIRFGIASGRGESLHRALRHAIKPRLWDKFIIGMYSGGHVVSLADDFFPPVECEDEYLERAAAVLEEINRTTGSFDTIARRPHQISVHGRPGVSSDDIWQIIADNFRLNGLSVAHIKKSGHSVDVTGLSVSKLNVRRMLEERCSSPLILNVGDQGCWPGNDHELLDCEYSLSVDAPSRSLASGWKLSPSAKRGPAATLWYLRRILLMPGGRFKLTIGQSDI